MTFQVEFTISDSFTVRAPIWKRIVMMRFLDFVTWCAIHQLIIGKIDLLPRTERKTRFALTILVWGRRTEE